MNFSRNDNIFAYKLYSLLFSYDEKKYWKRRQILIDKNNKKFFLKKIWYLIYCKKMEARNAASLGTAINTGAMFESVPNLPHGITGIFVSHSAQIGKNCTILQNVTIGSSKEKAPVIGDNCIIGAGAVIVGGIHIGDNCRIGANCTVFKDVPSNTTVVCQPPRYISNNGKNKAEQVFKF